MDTKKLIEEVLLDLGNNKSLTDVSSKIQIIVRLLGDEKLKSWYTYEFVTGYKNQELPDYRISRAVEIKANYIVPQGFGAWKLSGQSVPVANLGLEKYKEIMTVRFCDTISAIIEYSKHPEDVAMSLSPYEQVLVQKVLGEAHIQNVYKVLSPSTFQTIIDNVQGRIIDMFMDLNERVFNGELDLKSSTAKEEIHQVITNNITAGIVNTGNGVVNAQGAMNIIGENNSVSPDCKEELLKILSEIDKIARTLQNREYDEVSSDIRIELEKDEPSKNFIKRCFQSIPSILTGVGTGVVANEVSPLVKAAIDLLSNMSM